MNTLNWSKVVIDILTSVGGIGAIIAFLANWWGNRLATKISNREAAQHEQELERLKSQLELTKSMVARYSEQQFVIYYQLWSSLYELKFAGDQLWELANQVNLRKFARQLRNTNSMVEKGSLFIEDEHYQQLHRLLQVFSNFETGKKRLIDIRERDDYVGEYEIHQITENRRSLDEYVALISEIRNSLRRQLNVQTDR